MAVYGHALLGFSASSKEISILFSRILEGNRKICYNTDRQKEISIYHDVTSENPRGGFLWGFLLH